MKVKDLIHKLLPYSDADLLVSVVDLSSAQWDFDKLTGPELCDDGIMPDVNILVGRDSVNIRLVIDSGDVYEVSNGGY